MTTNQAVFLFICLGFFLFIFRTGFQQRWDRLHQLCQGCDVDTCPLVAGLRSESHLVAPVQYFFLGDFHSLSFALDCDDCLFILLQVMGGEESVTISLQSVICNVSKLNKDGSSRRKLLSQFRSCNLLCTCRLEHSNKTPTRSRGPHIKEGF